MIIFLLPEVEIKKKSNFISRNVSDIYDKSNLGIVNLSSNFSVKEDTKNNNNTKSENKEKMNLSKYQRFIDLKKDLNEILNPKYIKEKNINSKNIMSIIVYLNHHRLYFKKK